MNRFKDCQTYSLYVSSMMMSKISTSDGIRHYYQQTNNFGTRSWNDCTSQNYKILFNYGLYWLCMIKKQCEMKGKQVISDWNKSSVRLYIDQKRRSRNEMICWGVVTRSRRGNKVNVERRVWDCSERNSRDFRHGANACGNTSKHSKQERSSSLASWLGAIRNEEEKSSDQKIEEPADRKSKIPSHWKNCTNPWCVSNVSKLHFKNTMQTWQKLFLPKY